MFVALVASITVCGAASVERIDLKIEGMKRNYYLHNPPNVDSGDPLPLVLVFHGGGPAGKQKGRSAAAFTGFIELADRERFIVAYPSSYSGNWTDGRITPHMPPAGVDDVAFVDAVLADISTRTAVDATRVYATGPSNGGFFSNRLACERTSTFAAMANVIGSMPLGVDCTPSAPISMLLVPGTSDPWVLWEGGPVAKRNRGESISLNDTVAFWVAHNACEANPIVQRLPDLDTTDDSTVLSERYGDCASDSEVWLLAVEGGGHAWPGGSQYLPKWLVGPVNRDIDAAEVIWSFFKQHSR